MHQNSMPKKEMPMMKMPMTTLLLLLVLSSAPTLAVSSPPPPCESDPSIAGYASILDLNLAFIRDASVLVPPLNEPPKDQYVYRLCPNTVLNADDKESSSSSSPIAPLLNNTNIICGLSGSSQDGCVIRGGQNHVLLTDPRTQDDDGDEVNNNNLLITFQGISFQSSTDTSIVSIATSRTKVVFQDCHWRYLEGRAGIVVAPGQMVPTPNKIPDFTYAFEASNIFDGLNRRQLELLSSNNEKDKSVPIMIELSDSTILESSGESFRAIFSRSAHVGLKNVIVADVQGLFVVNSVGPGGATIGNSRFARNTVSSVIRPIHSSTVTIKSSQFDFNNVLGTLVSVSSSMDLSGIYFYSNTVHGGGEILAYDSSQVTLANSCTENLMEAGATFFMDATSIINFFNTFADHAITSHAHDECAEQTEGTSSIVLREASTTSKKCFREDLDLTPCGGSCVALDGASECTLQLDESDPNPTFGEKVGSSASKSTPILGALSFWLGAISVLIC